MYDVSKHHLGAIKDIRQCFYPNVMNGPGRTGLSKVDCFLFDNGDKLQKRVVQLLSVQVLELSYTLLCA